MAVMLNKPKKPAYSPTSSYFGYKTPPKKPPAPPKTFTMPKAAFGSLAGMWGSPTGAGLQPAQASPTGGVYNSVVGTKQTPLVQPSYAGLIGGDWEVQDAETAMASRMASLRGDYTKNIRQAMIELGVSDPSKLGKFSSYIDADTISKAAANKYSQTADIAKREQTANAQSQAQLAARGMLSSGALTKEAGDITAKAERDRYSALQSFLGAGETGLRDISDEEYGLSRGVASARAAAAARAAQEYFMSQMGTGFEEGPYIDYGPQGAVTPSLAPGAAAARPAVTPRQALTPYARQTGYYATPKRPSMYGYATKYTPKPPPKAPAKRK